MKKFLAMLLAAILVVSCFACNGATNDGGKNDSKVEIDANDPYAATDFAYPMDGTVTLSINSTPTTEAELPNWVKGHYYWDVLQEKTGIKLEFIGSASKPQETSEEFSLLLTSGEYPDIMQANWITFKGGPETAINDGYIISLNGYEAFYPGLSGILAESAEFDTMVRTDDGTLYCFPHLKKNENQIGTGFSARQDYLDAIGEEAPTTVEEWYNVLTKFKNELNLKAPLTFESRWLFLEYATAGLSSPWGVCYPFFVEDGTVKFGPTSEGYEEFVTEMAKWYDEGLIDTDLASVDKSTVQSKFANGESGIALQQIRNIQNCIKANAENPEYKVIGLPSLVMNEGDEPQMSHYTNTFDAGMACSISTQCENIGACARFLDYAYTEEGALFNTYGEEGFSWEYVDGVPTFTDIIMNNEETPDTQAARYFVGNFQNWSIRVIDASSHLMPEVRDIQSTFFANMGSYAYPTVTHTDEEVDVVAKWNDIDTTCRERILGFILGNEDLANWDSFIAEIDGEDLKAIIDAKQAAYDRYIAR
jgi:putative aldouronate transport system substrate-binding protein